LFPAGAKLKLIFNILSLLFAPNAQHRKRTGKERKGADRETRINLGGMPEHKSMSRGACTEQNSHHSKCVFQKTLYHEQILSSGRSEDSQIPEALLTPFKPDKVSSAFNDSMPVFPVHIRPALESETKPLLRDL
jgi:hypothetical protein